MNELVDYLPILFYAAMMLIPIIPAFLLFKLLPSSGTVEGPLQGMQVKLGGAFAGYFAVLLLSYMVVNPVIKERQKAWGRYVALLESKTYQDWRVTGKVDVGAANPELVHVFVRPPDLHVQADGSFRFDIPMLTKANGQPDPPILVFDAPDFVPITLGLLPDISSLGGVTPVEQRYDIKARSIKLAPITLTPKSALPAYRPPQ